MHVIYTIDTHSMDVYLRAFGKPNGHYCNLVYLQYSKILMHIFFHFHKFNVTQTNIVRSMCRVDVQGP